MIAAVVEAIITCWLPSVCIFYESKPSPRASTTFSANSVRNGLGKVEDTQQPSDVNWHPNPAAAAAGTAYSTAAQRDQGPANMPMRPGTHNGQFIPGPHHTGQPLDDQQRLSAYGAPTRPMTAADVPRHIALEIIEAANQEGYMVSSSMPNVGQPGLKGGGRGVLTDRPGASAQQRALVPGVI